MAQTLRIGNKKVGNNEPVFIIAEMSANHNQSYDLAVKTIKAAKKAGADAIKMQTYTADTLTIDVDKKHFTIKQGSVWDGKSLYKLYQKAYMPWEWQPKLKKLAEKLGLICFSSPFDKTAVDFLEKMKVPAYKVASYEITDVPLIEYMASKGKPILISTGIATLSDMKEAVAACKKKGNSQIILLKCTSGYPAPLEEVNLKIIPDMIKRFNLIIGISDHTLGIGVPVAAVALGAKVIEKHFILDRSLGGPDSEFSLEPKEFMQMVNSVRTAEKALGKATYKLTGKMRKGRSISRSLFFVKDVCAGERITEDNVRSIRPGFGLHPREMKKIIRRKIKSNVTRGTPVSWRHIK